MRAKQGKKEMGMKLNREIKTKSKAYIVLSYILQNIHTKLLNEDHLVEGAEISVLKTKNKHKKLVLDFREFRSSNTVREF